jgi:hypothetical protein
VIVAQNRVLDQMMQHLDLNAIGAEALGPFRLEDTSYFKALEDWARKISGDDKSSLQCFIIRVKVASGRKMASNLLSAFIKTRLKIRGSDMKILMDPKELL